MVITIVLQGKKWLPYLENSIMNDVDGIKSQKTFKWS